MAPPAPTAVARTGAPTAAAPTAEALNALATTALAANALAAKPAFISPLKDVRKRPHSAAAAITHAQNTAKRFKDNMGELAGHNERLSEEISSHNKEMTKLFGYLGELVDEQVKANEALQELSTKITDAHKDDSKTLRDLKTTMVGLQPALILTPNNTEVNENDSEIILDLKKKMLALQTGMKAYHRRANKYRLTDAAFQEESGERKERVIESEDIRNNSIDITRNVSKGLVPALTSSYALDKLIHGNLMPETGAKNIVTIFQDADKQCEQLKQYNYKNTQQKIPRFFTDEFDELKRITVGWDELADSLGTEFDVGFKGIQQIIGATNDRRGWARVWRYNASQKHSQETALNDLMPEGLTARSKLDPLEVFSTVTEGILFYVTKTAGGVADEAEPVKEEGYWFFYHQPRVPDGSATSGCGKLYFNNTSVDTRVGIPVTPLLFCLMETFLLQPKSKPGACGFVEVLKNTFRLPHDSGLDAYCVVSNDTNFE